MSIAIKKELVLDQDRKAPPNLNDELPFGKVHSNHMFICDFLADQGGWQMPTIVPFAPFSFFPDAVVFHYGQQIFEGLKAYRTKNSHIVLFRPELNAQRFYHSAERMGMQPVPTELFVDGIKALVSVDHDFVLPFPASLYIRPCLIPLDRGVHYRASKNYRFFIILSAVNQYFSSHRAVSVLVEQSMVRAVRGGTGDTKAGANYAASVLALTQARNLGADSVLWLDALEQRYVEEIGAMNVMFVYEDRLVTPILTGTILPGVTRDSIITLARHFGLHVDEERIDIHQVIDDAKSGKLKEAFGCGTAAVISPINTLIMGNEHISIGQENVTPVAMKLKKALEDIKDGTADDIFSWRVTVPIDEERG